MKKVVLLLIISLIKSSFCCLGCVELGELTFSKVIKKFQTVLVKFDVQFPFGDTHDAFVAFANEINNETISGSNHSEVLCVLIGVKDYGELDNKALGEKYGYFKRQDFPGIKLFHDGNLENPINFEIGKDIVTINKLYLFLKTHSKVHVLAPGCVKELDELAETFINERTKRQDILREAENFIDKIRSEEKKKTAKTYTLLMKGVIENNEDYISKQRERMNKLLKTKLTERKTEELNLKLNILASFKVASLDPKIEL